MDEGIAQILVPPTLDAGSVAALGRAIEHAVRDPAARVLLLAGADGIFCRGMSLDRLVASPPPDGLAAAAQGFARCLGALRFAAKPTVAIVDGETLGGGLGIAAACDLVLATPRSTFGLPELLFGLLPAVVLPVLLERAPAQKVRLLALRAGSVPADQARNLGLVDEVLPADELPRAVRRWVRALSRPDPGAVATLKRYSAEATRLGVAAGLCRGAGLTAEALADGATLAAIRTFVDGEALPWIAR
jgi:enoyl-CoA hydratase/carnithine racemase